MRRLLEEAQLERSKQALQSHVLVRITGAARGGSRLLFPAVALFVLASALRTKCDDFGCSLVLHLYAPPKVAPVSFHVVYFREL